MTPWDNGQQTWKSEDVSSAASGPQPLRSRQPSDSVRRSGCVCVARNPGPDGTGAQRSVLEGLKDGEYFGADERFQIGAVLGSGGAAVVRLAFDRQSERFVAAKGVRGPCDAFAHAHLRSEGRAMAKICHPSVARMYDVVEHDGQPIVVMEWVDGPTLANQTRGKRLRPSLTLHLALELANALDCIHSSGVLHLDIKPQNLVLSPQGTLRLIDFGVGATRQDQLLGALDCDTRIFCGTPDYMAPEQWESQPVDARADIWAVGIVLYELLLGTLPCRPGQHPFWGSFRAGRCVAERFPQFGSVLEPLLAKTIALEPAQRFQSANHLCAALNTAQRAVVELELSTASPLQLLVLAALGVLEGSFDTARVRHTAGLSLSAFEGVRAALERDGVVTCLPGSRRIVVSRALAVSAFHRLPSALRARMGERLSAFGGEPETDRHPASVPRLPLATNSTRFGERVSAKC